MLNAETQRTRRREVKGEERKKAGSRSCPPGKEVPLRRQGLFEFFSEDGELELCFGQRLYDGGLGVFGGGVARRCHFTDKEILRAFQHFLFAEGEGLAAAEGNETLEDDGDFEEGPGAHALGVLFEAVLPVVMRVKFAFFEEAQDFGGFRRTNNGTKANGHRVGLRNHDAQATGNNANHEVTFGSAVQDSVADLLNNAHTVIRVNDLVADLVVHSFGCPPQETHKKYITLCCKSQDISCGIRRLGKIGYEFGS